MQLSKQEEFGGLHHNRAGSGHLHGKHLTHPRVLTVVKEPRKRDTQKFASVAELLRSRSSS